MKVEEVRAFRCTCEGCGWTDDEVAHPVDVPPDGPWDTEKLARAMAGDPDAPVANLMIDTLEAWILRGLDSLEGK